MKKFTECKIAGPAKLIRKNMLAIALLDESKKKCLLIPVPLHINEIFVTLFFSNVRFKTPLIHDFVAEILAKQEEDSRYKVEELRIEHNKYLMAIIIFKDGRTQELRLEDALALAGRNNWKIKVENSLLLKNEGNISPQMNSMLIEAMENNISGLPNDFEVISSSCGGWGCFKKTN